MREGYIDEKTAQLILDAIAWCNRDWMDAMNWNYNDSDVVSMAQGDFVRFCHERGIEGVERTITLEDVLKGLNDNED